MGRLSMRPSPLDLNQALASDQLEEFVRQEEARGAELVEGSAFERALALLITQRRIRAGREPRAELKPRASSHPVTACGIRHYTEWVVVRPSANQEESNQWSKS